MGEGPVTAAPARAGVVGLWASPSMSSGCPHSSPAAHGLRGLLALILFRNTCSPEEMGTVFSARN